MSNKRKDFIIYKPTSKEDYEATVAELVASGMQPFQMTGYKDRPENPIYVTYSPTLSRGLPVFTDGTTDSAKSLTERCQVITDRVEFVNLVKGEVGEALKGEPLVALLQQLLRG